MRTIKFRGKDVFTDAWRYGDLVHNQKVTTTGLEPRVMVGGYEVDPETVGQSSATYSTIKQKKEKNMKSRLAKKIIKASDLLVP